MASINDTGTDAQDRQPVRVEDLRKEFSVSRGVEVAVDDVDFVIGEEEFMTLVGPSGCGKTTTLRCIAGLETPTSGQIRFGSQEVTDIPANKRDLAMMFQNIALYPHMTILENIAYPLKVHGVKQSKREEEAQRAAEIMKIPEMLDKYPGDVSGGQRQRAALARTIVQDPKAFLMDEPLSDLDAKLKIEIRKEIQRVQKRVRTPTLYVTHDQEEAMTMSDRIAVMNDGHIEQIGTPDEIYERPANRFVARFIGNPTMNFMNGTVTDDGVEVSVGEDTFSIDVATGSHAAGRPVTVGVRPGSMLLDPVEDGDLEGELLLLERIGDRILATIDADTEDGEVRATVTADHRFAEGETVRFRLDREQVFLFDRETGKAVGY
jgi:multiple sugar transport system ATP-binding protein